jgi:hypothetical protein
MDACLNLDPASPTRHMIAVSLPGGYLGLEQLRAFAKGYPIVKLIYCHEVESR